MLALRTRWLTLVQAQVEDIATADGGPSGVVRALAAGHPGLVRALRRPTATEPGELVAGAA
jgi:hypothetical protein